MSPALSAEWTAAGAGAGGRRRTDERLNAIWHRRRNGIKLAKPSTRINALYHPDGSQQQTLRYLGKRDARTPGPNRTIRFA